MFGDYMSVGLGSCRPFAYPLQHRMSESGNPCESTRWVVEATLLSVNGHFHLRLGRSRNVSAGPTRVEALDLQAILSPAVGKTWRFAERFPIGAEHVPSLKTRQIDLCIYQSCLFFSSKSSKHANVTAHLLWFPCVSCSSSEVDEGDSLASPS